MNTNVIYLTAAVQQPELDPVLSAAAAFMLEWQRGHLKPLPTLYRSLERHAYQLNDASKEMMAAAQTSEAYLRTTNMGRIIQRAEVRGVTPSVISLVQSTINTVRSNLTIQTAELKSSLKHVSALPALDASRDQARLLQEQASVQTILAARNAELEVESAKLEAMQAALAALEAIDVEVKFDGMLPTPEQLAALALPGGQAAVLAEAAAKALKDLEKAIGQLIGNLNYGRLQDERRQQAGTVRTLKQEIAEAGQALRQCQLQLKALEIIPSLLEMRSGWMAAVNVLIVAMEGFGNRLSMAKPQDVEALRDIEAVFTALLAYQRSVIKQISDAF
ncbi:MAG: alpha-xenorhabdolysin family binary toxin subunit B [Paucimonas sp.]|nr:alpha-xenorhabdolysin family binary toxin subunit B [Paucimonas sp.]